MKFKNITILVTDEVEEEKLIENHQEEREFVAEEFPFLQEKEYLEKEALADAMMSELEKKFCS